jgi:hypothetical protein
MTVVSITDAELELVETLRTALYKANALDGDHAYENGGSYGTIKVALITTLAFAIHKSTTYPVTPFTECEDIARRIYDEVVDNGEDVKYNIDLWNEGVITL